MAVHRFQPEVYHITIGSHEPVLRIADGDTVITTTVDARGRNERGEVVAPRSNPQTGPFYIEGAEVGDTLAVHFDRLIPNRDTGWSATVLASNVVDPGFVHELPRDAPLAEWEIDRERGTATLASPETRLGRLTLPI